MKRTRFYFVNRFLSIKPLLPTESLDSYLDTGLRCEPRWLARSNSGNPSAAGRKSRRLRRRSLRTFAPKRDLNRPIQPPLVRSPLAPRVRRASNSSEMSLQKLRGGRSDKRASLRTVEVEHVLETPQQKPSRRAGTTSPLSLAKCTLERQPAEPNAPASEVNPPIYESADSAGTIDSNDKNEFLPRAQLQMSATMLTRQFARKNLLD